MRRRVPRAIIITFAIVAIAAAAAVIVPRFLRPRGAVAVPLADPAEAKRLGDELLASTDTTVAVFIAHPDDAEWWIGGTLGMLAKHNRVILVLGTSGEAGNGGLQSDLGEIRERLQLEGAKILGYADVVFLRHPDGHLAEAEQYPAEVAALLERLDPSTVITFDTEHEAGGYHHVDHEAAGRAALAAVRDRGGIALYLFHSAAPDVICDFKPVAEAKSKALSTLASYHDSSPLGWLSRAARAVGLEHAAVSFGGSSRFAQVDVQYGELFRKD
ncbi:MAG TPA: PIG-L family deacetylase [Coriobacteriia bacterium]